MSEELQRDVGRHDAQIEGLERRMKTLEEKVDEMLAILNQAKGSWKTLVAVGGFAAAIGGFVGWLLHFFIGK